MRTTIDGAGRIVVPKPIRDELGLTAGAEIEVRLVDGRVEIEPVAPAMRVERGADGYPVAVPDRELPVLTAERVRDLLEQVRR
jgi:AbrB family looped-hinge helix DNA binding protein